MTLCASGCFPRALVTACDEHVSPMAEAVAGMMSGRGRWMLYDNGSPPTIRSARPPPRGAGAARSTIQTDAGELFPQLGQLAALIQQRIRHVYRRQRPTPLPSRMAKNRDHSQLIVEGGAGPVASWSGPAPQ
jgi:hypothetical protein